MRFTSPVVRDEQEQARHLGELLNAFDRSAIDAAFVNTFARYDLPHSGADDRDFDKASYGIVKVLDGGRTAAPTRACHGSPRPPSARSRTTAGTGPTAPQAARPAVVGKGSGQVTNGGRSALLAYSRLHPIQPEPVRVDISRSAVDLRRT